MLRSLTAKQFRNWELYDEMEPFGEKRADYRTASIVQVIANVNRGTQTPAYKLEDFVLPFGDEPSTKPKQSWQEQLKLLTVFSSAHNQVLKDEMDKARKAMGS